LRSLVIGIVSERLGQRLLLHHHANVAAGDRFVPVDGQDVDLVLGSRDWLSNSLPVVDV
jgi:hypothetical protein